MKAKVDNIEATISLINQYIGEGKTKTEIGKLLGFRGNDGLYQYIKRLGYTWNEERRIYEKPDAGEYVSKMPTGLPAKIVAMFAKEMHPKDVAREAGFETCIDMGNFMKGKGYAWSMAKLNYEKISELEIAGNNAIAAETTNNSDARPTESREDYKDIFTFLEANREKLEKLLALEPQAWRKIPRYLLKGVPVTKSIHMVNTLHILAHEFSREKNITQREIFEVALIDFFNKYGYAGEIRTILGGKSYTTSMTP